MVPSKKPNSSNDNDWLVSNFRSILILVFPVWKFLRYVDTTQNQIDWKNTYDEQIHKNPVLSLTWIQT